MLWSPQTTQSSRTEPRAPTLALFHIKPTHSDTLWKFRLILLQLPLICSFIKTARQAAGTELCSPAPFIGEGDGTPFQYSCLENPMDGGAWWAAVHGVAKSQIRLSKFPFTFHFHALEKEMATHSSVLAWRIPGMEEPGGLPSMGSHGVRHD